jgi:hypothetical protein
MIALYQQQHTGRLLHSLKPLNSTFPPSTFIQYTFVIEGAFNTLPVIVMIFKLSRILSFIVAKPSETIHTAALLL